MAKIKHIAIATQDPDGTARFYKEVFGLQEVGRVDNENAEGHYLSDGNVNLAILRFKNDVVAGEEFGAAYSGFHHIGFEVEDTAATDAKLRKANSEPRADINAALNSRTGARRRNNRYLSYGLGWHRWWGLRRRSGVAWPATRQ